MDRRRFIKTCGMGTASLALQGCVGSNLPAGKNVRKPNLLYIMLDDLGPEWLSCYGGEEITTPHMDALAGEGMRFTRAYSMPQCTPTRASLLTGQYPFRTGWVNHWDVPRWGSGCHFDWNYYTTFAQVMKGAGYATAVAGKWQINDFRVQPDALERLGFDDWCMWTGYEKGNPPSGERYWDPYLHTREGSRTYEGRFGEEVFTDFLIDFMKENRDRPMMLYYPMCLPHWPLVATPLEPEAEGKEARFRAMVRYIDHTVGRLAAALDALGLRKDTIIFLTSDNGSGRSITARMAGREVKGGKGTIAESGCRAPFIVNGPGRVPNGVVTDALTDCTDMLPTFAELGGARLRADLEVDGRSMAGVILGRDENSPREWVMAMGGGPAVHDGKRVVPRVDYAPRAVADKRFKLWVEEGKAAALYDLDKDPGEEHDLLDSTDPLHVEARERLEAVAKTFPAKDGAPLYDPMPLQPWELPNIVLIMADDLGWGDTGYNGHPVLKTPNLDAMAEGGVRFDRFYAAAPVCSPTRGSCLTGRHPYRYGIFGANKGHMPDEEETLAELLKPLGYTTGHFGKWHLGTLTKRLKDSNRGGPKGAEHYAPPWEHGFDVCFSTEAKVPTWNPMVTPEGWKKGDEGKPFGTYYWTGPGEKADRNLEGDDSRVIMDRAIPFVQEAVEKGKPFFTVVWFHTPHAPVEAGPDHRKEYAGRSDGEQHYFGCVTAMDEQIGRLRDELRALGVEKKTMVWFCSDNGPEGKKAADRNQGSAGPFRGRKRSLFEGGVRVPGLLEWPAKVKKPRVVEMPCCTSDYFPTLLDVLGLPKDAAVEPRDGVSLLPAIAGKETKRPSPIGFESGKQISLTDNRYKIISQDKGETYMLFDLGSDPGEQQDLAAARPEIVEKMRKILDAWRASCKASLEGKGYE